MRKFFVGPIILAIVILSLLTFLLFGPDTRPFFAKLAQVREIATPPTDLLAAQTRWTANPIKHYRLKVQHHLGEGDECLTYFEVVDERMVTTFEDSCSMYSYFQKFILPSNTVTQLFAKLQKETTTIHFLEPDNPNCGTFVSVDITYSSIGYPSEAKYHWVDISPWTLGPDTYKRMYGAGNIIDTCSMAINPPELSVVVSLQPLP